jgi:hypothetical protein
MQELIIREEQIDSTLKEHFQEVLTTLLTA